MASRRSRGAVTGALVPEVIPPPPKRQSPVVRANAHVRSQSLPSLTAAASIQNQDGSVPPSNGPARIWQEQSWAYFDSAGIAKYAGLFYGKCLSRVRLVAGVMGPDGSVQSAFDDEGPVEGASEADEVSQLLSELRAPMGGQPALLRSFGVALFVAGECMLLGVETTPGDASTQQWEVLSTDELRRQPSGGSKKKDRWVRIMGPGMGFEAIPEGSFECRIWQPHERYKRMADSSMRGVLDVLEEYVLLTREVRAEALSRIPNGILLVPDEVSLVNTQPQDGTDLDEGDIPPGDEAEDEFTIDLLETLMAAIKDKGSASAMVPYVLRGPADALKEVRHLLLSRPESARALVKRREAIEAFAMGIDLPVEVVLGHQSTTFANAFAIDEDKYKTHIQPMMQIVADGLTHGYLWPKMAARRSLDPSRPMPEEITRNVVFWDATQLVSHPDRSKEAVELHKVFAISNAALRRTNGFSESDKPDAAELGERLNILRLSNIRETIRVDDTTPITSDLALSGKQIDQALTASAAGGDVLAQLAMRLAGAAEVVIERAVDRLGFRLRTKASKNGHAAVVDGVVNNDVARALGRSACATYLAGDALFPGEFEFLRETAQRWGEQIGLDTPVDFASRVAWVAEQVAEMRLFSERPISDEMFLALLTNPAIEPAPLGH